MREVALKAGVSSATVSYVLNGRSETMRIAAETRERLAAYCRREFSGAINTAVWNQILAMHSRPGVLLMVLRTTVAALWLGASWMRRGARQVIGRRTPRGVI